MEGFIIGKPCACLNNSNFVCFFWFNPTSFNNFPDVNRFLKEAHSGFPIAIVHPIKGQNRIKILRHNNQKQKSKGYTQEINLKNRVYQALIPIEKILLTFNLNQVFVCVQTNILNAEFK
jgi:hypothetical protein